MPTKQEVIDRAAQARFVLENPAYTEAFTKFTQDIRSLRLQLSPRDVEGASRLIFMEQAVEKAKRHLDNYVAEGDAALKQLESDVKPTPIGRLTGRFRRG